MLLSYVQIKGLLKTIQAVLLIDLIESYLRLIRIW